MVGQVKEALEIESAKVEIAKLEARAVLPASKAAGFVQLMGGLTILLSFFALFRDTDVSIIGVLSGIVLGGFIIAAGTLVQYIFDLRTLMLREALRTGQLGLVPLETLDA